METLPFRLLYSLHPALLTHPASAAALSAVLESPLLRVFEALVNSVVGLLAPGDHDLNTSRLGTTWWWGRPPLVDGLGAQSSN